MRSKLISLIPAGALVAAGFGLTAATEPAQSQAQCNMREAMVKQLSEQYGEKPAAVGQVDQQSLVEIFVSENGTWTILVTGTDGGSCVLAAGESWDSTDVLAAAAMHGA